MSQADVRPRAGPEYRRENFFMTSPTDAAQPEAQEPSPAEVTVEEALALAIELHRGGELDNAEQVYRRILEACPDNPNAIHYLGTLLHHRGDSEAGLELVRKALAIAPDYIDAHNSLGNILDAQHRTEESAAAYRRAIEIDPRFVPAYNNLGLALKKLRRYEEALEVLRKGIELDPENGPTHYNAAGVLSRLDRKEEAIEEYRKAVELAPGIRHGYSRLAGELRRAGRLDEAISVLRLLLEREPDSPYAKHFLAAFTGSDVPPRASDGYVRETFDVFSDSFDKLLMEKLDYRGPALMRAAVAEAFGTPQGRLDVLDAGCGTGLSGPELRPYAARLVGVDLSTRMLSRAVDRKVYDVLAHGDLVRFMREHPAEFDLIIISDTLVYFGDLTEAVQASFAALRSGGALVFSLEHSQQDVGQRGYRLEISGRYTHGEDYVRGVVGACGFAAHTVQHEILRREGKEWVAGLVVSARK
jgi:predicted TPR repeat methyltransferase